MNDERQKRTHPLSGPFVLIQCPRLFCELPNSSLITHHSSFIIVFGVLWAGVVAAEAALGAERPQMEASAEQVGKYEKVEFVVRLDTRYHNPFDPDEVDLSVSLKAPSAPPAQHTGVLLPELPTALPE